MGVAFDEDSEIAAEVGLCSCLNKFVFKRNILSQPIAKALLSPRIAPIVQLCPFGT